MDFKTTTPLNYNQSPRQTTQATANNRQESLTPAQVQNIPKVMQLLDRWEPKAIDQSSFGVKDEDAQKKAATEFLADPNKVGLRDFGINLALLVVLPELAFHGVELLCNKIPKKMPKIITENMAKYGKFIGFMLLTEAIITTLIQIPLSLLTANKQKETNNTALKAIQNKGINATLGDS